jgi:hypothetical protein
MTGAARERSAGVRSAAERSTAERSTAEWYRSFAEREARGQSALYEEWALGVAADAELRALLEQLPLQKRQPNLIFAVARLLGAPEAGYAAFRAFLIDAWPEVAAEAMVRMTQTNEPRRCASLLPAIASIDGPIALLEVGASAGLCLFPDRYSYSWDGHRLDPADGPSSVLLESDTNGRVPVPSMMPEIVWRAGYDLHPLDVAKADDRRWLETLVWPEQHERRDRLTAAIEIARQHRVAIVEGDAVERLAALAAQAPTDARLVVIVSGVLVYLTAERRGQFVDQVRELDADWISLEGRAALPSVAAALPAGPADAVRSRFVLARNEVPLAYTGPHGQSLDWF